MGNKKVRKSEGAMNPLGCVHQTHGKESGQPHSVHPRRPPGRAAMAPSRVGGPLLSFPGDFMLPPGSVYAHRSFVGVFPGAVSVFYGK